MGMRMKGAQTVWVRRIGGDEAERRRKYEMESSGVWLGEICTRAKPLQM